jgi:hypothetical protein
MYDGLQDEYLFLNAFNLRLGLQDSARHAGYKQAAVEP